MSTVATDCRNVFANELAFFEMHKPEWLASHQGDFVVVSGKEVGGFFSSYEGALRAGIRRFGVQGEFLIKQIFDREPVFAIY